MTYRRVPDTVQRSPGDAKHRPVTLLRRAGTHPEFISWAPDQQRTTPQGRRVAQHPGHAMGTILRWARAGFARKKIVAGQGFNFQTPHVHERDFAFPRRDAP
jgi:hypothetical protein